MLVVTLENSLPTTFICSRKLTRNHFFSLPTDQTRATQGQRDNEHQTNFDIERSK